MASNNVVYSEDNSVYCYDSSSNKLLVTSQPSNTSHQKLTALLKDLFLPRGYPHTVSEDYLQYQIWDTIQAFASSITGSLSTKAVLEGVGVGNADATPLAATLTWLIKDGTGMVGRILFAWCKGGELDSNCKQWRLFADVLNDTAMCVELCVPMFPQSLTLPMLCAASLAKSLVGVAGGATRAALTQHQARENNMADVSAKDGSQETLVNLIALICNLILLPLVAHSQSLVWTLFIIFTCLHIYANYCAVRSVHIDLFNTSRLQLTLQHYITLQQLLPPSSINMQESLIPGVDKLPFGDISLGSSLQPLIKVTSGECVRSLLEDTKSNYIIYSDSSNKTHVVLREGVHSAQILHAYVTACLINTDYGGEKIVKEFLEHCSQKGWNISHNLLNAAPVRGTW